MLRGGSRWRCRDVAGLVVVVGVVAPHVVVGRALVMADAPWAASNDNRVAASDHPGAGVSVLCVVEPANVAKGAVLVGAGAAVGGVCFAVTLARCVSGRVAAASVRTDVPGCSCSGWWCCSGYDDGGCSGLRLGGSAIVTDGCGEVGGAARRGCTGDDSGGRGQGESGGKAAGGDRPGVSRCAAGCRHGARIRCVRCSGGKRGGDRQR